MSSKRKPRTCERCGREFRPTNAYQSACPGGACQKVRCDWCCTPIKPLNRRHRHCSSSCRRASFEAQFYDTQGVSYRQARRLQGSC